MSQSVMKKNEQALYLDNAFWKREHFLKNHVTLHTIQCLKISNELVKRLQDQDFKIVDSSYNESVTVQPRKNPDYTEIHEMHLDKLKVTEAVIVSHVTPNGKNKRVIVNEGEPTENGFPEIKKPQLRELLSIEDNHPNFTVVGTNETEAKVDRSPEKLDLANHDFKKVEHQHIVFRQEVVRKKNSFFLRSKDSANLFKLGNSYYEDFKNGYKHFSFINLSAPEDQKKTVLGIASFIYYYENLKILILTHSLENSSYSEFVKEENKQVIDVSSETHVDIYVHEGLNYMDVKELTEKSENNQGLEVCLNRLVQDFDVVFYDLPTFEKSGLKQKVNFPILQLVQNVSFVVCFAKNTFTEIRSLQKYFSDYKIKVKGVVVGRE